ncbi:MAG: hypothetical protein ACP5JG_01060 [Anaerolineae bacterium]
MMKVQDRVNVYASGLGFVVVPVAGWATGQETEMVPVHRVSLERGNATVVDLSLALEAAQEEAQPDPSDAVNAWDGDDGRWWAHNLAFVKITWYPDKVVFAPQEQTPDGDWQTRYSEELPATTNVDDLSRALIRYLGERLHP